MFENNHINKEVQRLIKTNTFKNTVKSIVFDMKVSNQLNVFSFPVTRTTANHDLFHVLLIVFQLVPHKFIRP